MSALLDIPFHKFTDFIPPPLKIDPLDFFKEIEYKNTDFMIYPLESMNQDLIYFLNHHSIKCTGFICWRWSFSRTDIPLHTDGNYFIEKRRHCGINWCYSPDTYVKFFDPQNGIPYLKEIKGTDYGDKWYHTTLWKFDGEARTLVDWEDEGPVIFNTQIPHLVYRKNGDIQHRKSIALKLGDEIYDTLVKKLEYLIK